MNREINLRKINASITWLLIICLLGHMGTMCYSLLTGWYDYIICKTMAFSTGIVCSIHIILSVYLVFARSGGATTGPYKRMNWRTLTQRISGLLILVLLYPHITDFNFIVQGSLLAGADKMQIMVVELLFFASVFTHLAISFSKSLISAGRLRSERAEKLIDRSAAVVCLLLLALAVYAVWQFLYMQWIM